MPAASAIWSIVEPRKPVRREDLERRFQDQLALLLLDAGASRAAAAAVTRDAAAGPTSSGPIRWTSFC